MHEPFDYAELDPGIVPAVRVLREASVRTLWSCEGGPGHTSDVPYIAFEGDAEEAQRVVRFARAARLGPTSLVRSWNLADGDPDVAAPVEDAVEWRLELVASFPATDEARRASASRQAAFSEGWRRQHDEDAWGRAAIWEEVVQLEPRLKELHDCVSAGRVDMNAVWLTCLSAMLEPLVGPARLEPAGPDLLRETSDCFTRPSATRSWGAPCVVTRRGTTWWIAW